MAPDPYWTGAHALPLGVHRALSGYGADRRGAAACTIAGPPSSATSRTRRSPRPPASAPSATGARPRDRRRVRAEPARCEGRQLPRLPPSGGGPAERWTTTASSSPSRSRRRTARSATRASTTSSRAAVTPRLRGRRSTARRTSRPSSSRSASATTPRWVNRAPMSIGAIEGPSAIVSGCNACHAIGKPNADGSFGTCTNCHSRHLASIELAREPSTCGQCHMGPDHSQLEIYDESKHGVALRGPARAHEPAGRPEAPHDGGHAGPDVRDVPHERAARREDDA